MCLLIHLRSRQTTLMMISWGLLGLDQRHTVTCYSLKQIDQTKS